MLIPTATAVLSPAYNASAITGRSCRCAGADQVASSPRSRVSVFANKFET
ncbi:MAG: hypothetical protein R3B97_17255 [Dehalococcoidia bacterium]